jgi:hypothetical protein
MSINDSLYSSNKKNLHSSKHLEEINHEGGVIHIKHIKDDKFENNKNVPVKRHLLKEALLSEKYFHEELEPETNNNKIYDKTKLTIFMILIFLLAMTFLLP